MTTPIVQPIGVVSSGSTLEDDVGLSCWHGVGLIPSIAPVRAFAMVMYSLGNRFVKWPCRPAG